MRTLQMAWGRVWSPEEYTEPAMFARAALINLLLPFIMLVGEPPHWSHWLRAGVLWLVASILTYRYGYWTRDDEGD